MSRPATLGQLRESGWESVPVKDEVRRNVAARIAAGEPVVDRRRRLRRHRPAPAGERPAGRPRHRSSWASGARPRPASSARSTELLDEWMPVVAGSEINDDPYHPVSRHARDLVRDHGDDTPIEWVHRSTRFGEKLATPDTSIADLIGEVDPIKVAEGRYLSDELTLHYGLVPRTNRGIFAINELPDLAERIQVGLLNVLEERDIQVRGYKIRLPLDIDAGGLGQPRGLHQPGPDHHPAQGPLRRPDPHPLPARHRHRAGRRPPGGPAAGRVGGAPGATCRPTWPRSWPPSATRPAAAPTSTSARACRCGCRSPTTRRWWPTPPGGPCAWARRWPCPGSATWRRCRPPPPARWRSRPSTRATTGAVLDRIVKTSVLVGVPPGAARWSASATPWPSSTAARSSTPATTCRRPTT